MTKTELNDPKGPENIICTFKFYCARIVILGNNVAVNKRTFLTLNQKHKVPVSLSILSLRFS